MKYPHVLTTDLSLVKKAKFINVSMFKYLSVYYMPVVPTAFKVCVEIEPLHQFINEVST